MTLQTLPTTIEYPGMCSLFSGASPGIAAVATISTGLSFSIVMRAPRDMTLGRVAFNPGTVSASGTFDIRLETVTDGTPTGTLLNGSDSNIAGGALTSNTWNAQSFTGDSSVTKGQVFALKFAYNSGTSAQVMRLSNASVQNFGSPYIIDTAAAKSITRPLVVALGSDSAWYSIPGLFPTSVTTTATAGTFTAEALGVRFQVPFKCRCVGISYYPAANAGNFNVILQNDSNADLSTTTTAADGDNMSNSTSAYKNQIYFDTAVELSPGVWYRAVIEWVSGTCAVYDWTLNHADYLAAMPGGSTFYYSTRATGSWVDTDTRVPIIDILIDQLDDGASVGGVSHIIGS
jgi:hypothetical protein